MTMILFMIQVALLLSFHIEAISANNRHTLTAYHRHDIENSRISPLHYQQRQHRLSIINERKSIPIEEQEREQRERVSFYLTKRNVYKCTHEK